MADHLVVRQDHVLLDLLSKLAPDNSKKCTIQAIRWGLWARADTRPFALM